MPLMRPPSGPPASATQSTGTSTTPGPLPSDTVLQDLAALQRAVDMYMFCIPRPDVPVRTTASPLSSHHGNADTASGSSAGSGRWVKRGPDMDVSVEQYAGSAVALNGLPTSGRGGIGPPIDDEFNVDDASDERDRADTAADAEDTWEGFPDSPSITAFPTTTSDARRAALLSLGQELVELAIRAHCVKLLGSLSSKLYVNILDRSSPEHTRDFPAAAEYLSDRDTRQVREAEREVKLALGSYVLGRFASAHASDGVNADVATQGDDPAIDLQSHAPGTAAIHDESQETDHETDTAITVHAHDDETAGTKLLRHLYANWTPAGARQLDDILRKELGDAGCARGIAHEMAEVLAEESVAVREKRCQLAREVREMMVPVQV